MVAPWLENLQVLRPELGGHEFCCGGPASRCVLTGIGASKPLRWW